MSKIASIIHSIHHTDAMAARTKWINNIHPLAKLIVTLWYIVWVVSFHKYDLTGISGMFIYLMVFMSLAGLPYIETIKRIRHVLLFVGTLSVANLFFDTAVLTNYHQIPITGGLISMVTLVLKSLFTVLAAHLLITTTSIEGVCYALRQLYIPKPVVITILLTYRYIIVFLKETERISIAYSMRAPNHKGIHFKVWGSLAGQLLLRSIDRAGEVYESMLLRGFDGDFHSRPPKGFRGVSMLFTVVFMVLILILHNIPVFEFIGNLIA